MPIGFSSSILRPGNSPQPTYRHEWNERIQIGMQRYSGYLLQMYFDEGQVKRLFPWLKHYRELEVALVAVQDPVAFGAMQGGQTSWSFVEPEGIPCPCHPGFFSRFYLIPRNDVTNIYLHFDVVLQYRGDQPQRVKMDRRLRVHHNRSTTIDYPIYV